MNAFLKAFLISLAVLLLVFAGINLVFDKTETSSEYPPEESREYYRDSFTLLTHDSKGTPILMDMDFNRKEKNGHFIHYYSGTMWYGDDKQTFSTQFSSEQSEIEAHDYLESYSDERFTDLSTRESHQINLSSKWGPLSFAIETEGDFLTKNTLDYLRFSSAVETTLMMDNQELPTHILWEEVHSNDYSKSIFFEDRDKLESETILFTLWDEEGNFYHIDQSDVASESENYASHTWLLYKDKATNSTQKSYEATITPGEEQIQVELPEWNIIMDLTPPADWTGPDESGRIEGTITNPAGETQKIEGYFKHALY